MRLINFANNFSSTTVTFYSHTLYLLCASFVISVIVINLSRNPKANALPSSLKKGLLDGFIGRCLSASSDTNKSIREDQVEKALEENKINDGHHVVLPTNTKAAHLIQNEWIRLAIIIDRIAFIVYVIIYILMGFIHFI